MVSSALALEKMKASDFVKKYSVQFTSASGCDSQPFYFDEMNPPRMLADLAGLRSEFDDLLDNARKKAPRSGKTRCDSSRRNGAS